MDYVDDGPDWWTKRPEEAISHYLDHQDELIDEVLRPSDTQEVEVDPADRSAYPESTEGRPWGQPLKKPAGAPLNLG